MAPLLARHGNEIYLDPALFGRVEAVWRQRASLGPEEARVVDRYHTIFVRAGAALGPEGKLRWPRSPSGLPPSARSSARTCWPTRAASCWCSTAKPDLAGLPDWLVAAAAEAATERGRPGKHVITLSRSSIEPFLTFSTRRDLREKAFEAWVKRGEFGGPTDNRALISEMISLRAERARLMGYGSYAEFRLADTMAKTPAAVRELLEIGVEAGAAARSGRGARAAGRDRVGRRQLPRRAVGLAALCRARPQARLRFRRGRAEAPTSSSTA